RQSDLGDGFAGWDWIGDSFRSPSVWEWCLDGAERPSGLRAGMEVPSTRARRPNAREDAAAGECPAPQRALTVRCPALSSIEFPHWTQDSYTSSLAVAPAGSA